MNSSLCRLLYRASSQRNPIPNLHFFSTKIPQKPISNSTSITASDWKRPSEIQFEANLANSVSLIGYVSSPVNIQTTSDGFSWASTVISQTIPFSGDDDNSIETLPLWVPVIFEGDLAHIAASHLKETDRVYVSGLLSPDLPHLDGTEVQARLQIMARDIKFIEKDMQMQMEISDAFIESVKDSSDISESVNKNKDTESSLWRDLIDNPQEWWDNRELKKNRKVAPRYPDFTHKDSGEALWLSREQRIVVKKLGLEFDVPVESEGPGLQCFVITMKQGLTYCLDSENPTFYAWRDLFNRPQEWRDFRSSKIDGKASLRHPDFKRKDGTGSPLWLFDTPRWMLSKLEGLKFANYAPKEEDCSVDNLWKDLVENPSEWWDKRGDKFDERAPDFNHKKTGAVLWLTNSPEWASSKLPSPMAKTDEARSMC